MKVIKLKESDLEEIVKKVLIEQRVTTPLLKFGMRDENKNGLIHQLQQKLMDLGLLKTKSQKPTGYFGPLTRDAVRQFQSNNKITPTGKFDSKTKNYLDLQTQNFVPFGSDILKRKPVIPQPTEKKQTDVPTADYNCIAITPKQCRKISKDKNVIIDRGEITACAKYMNKCLSEYDKDIAGNAWTVLDNIKRRGVATEKYNLFKRMDWNKIWDKVSKDVTKKLCDCHINNDHADNKCGSRIPNLVVNAYSQKTDVDISQLKLGDIVGLYYMPSTNKGQAFCNGLKFDKDGKAIKGDPFEFNSHVGFVVSIKDGVPIILHNIGDESGKGNRHATPVTQLRNNGLQIAWIAQDNLVSQRLESQKNLPPFNSNILATKP